MKISTFIYAALLAANCNFVLAQTAADTDSVTKSDDDQRMFKVVPNYKTVNGLHLSYQRHYGEG